MAGFAVFHPNGTQIIPYEYTMSGQTAEEVSQGGYYAVCVDNQFARYSGKLISIYLTVIRYEEWTRYTEEISKLDVNINTFTVRCAALCNLYPTPTQNVCYLFQNALTKVQHNIQAMMHHQNSFRGLESRDIGLLEDNRAYVQNWSIIQIIVVVATTTIQVCGVAVVCLIRTFKMYYGPIITGVLRAETVRSESGQRLLANLSI